MMGKISYDIVSGVPGVRLATKADEEQIYKLLLLLHDENGLFRLNHEKVLAGIRWATERKGGVIFVIEHEGRIVASLGMTICQDWYTDDEYLLERWNFVHPDHRRGTDYGRRLLEQGKWSSEWFRVNANHPMPFMCGINSFERTEAKVRLYARHMPCIGANFLFGQTPRQKAKFDEALRSIKQHNKKQRKEDSTAVVPVVETVLRLSQREQKNVREKQQPSGS